MLLNLLANRHWAAMPSDDARTPYGFNREQGAGPTIEHPGRVATGSGIGQLRTAGKLPFRLTKNNLGTILPQFEYSRFDNPVSTTLALVKGFMSRKRPF
jgi:hypothetical protein